MDKYKEIKEITRKHNCFIKSHERSNSCEINNSDKKVCGLL